ncbi:MAG: carboxypeptidase-like regulatory domain-containing protein, partial [Candidatus Staskawiczbacteria bacterium]|nr:carboxypeptidase-like regulatory domain-containing protein [Candidatus Staskawiczbacteria bacterium]
GYPKYCVDTANTCTPATTYDSGNKPIISAEGTSYIRYNSVDNANNTESIESSTIKIDKTAPSTTDNFANDNVWVNSDQTITLTPTDVGGSALAYTKYCTDTNNTCDPASGTTLNSPYQITISTQGTSYFRYASQDNAGNTQATVSHTINIDKIAPVLAEVTPVPALGSNTTPNYTFSSTKAGTIAYSGGCSSTTGTASVGSNTITFTKLDYATYANCKITVIDSLGNLSLALNISSFTVSLNGANGYVAAPTSTNTTPATSIISQITSLFTGQQQTPQINYPPISESVPQQTPSALQGLNIMSVNPLNGFALSPVATDISSLADKLPQLKKTLVALNVDLNNLQDVAKLSQTELYLPGLTQTISPEGLQVNALASMQGIPLADLSADALAKIPTNLVFARASGELIDFSSAFVIDKQGNTQQKIKTIAGKSMQLVIKPDKPADSVVGLITLNSPVSYQAPQNSFAKLFRAALTGAINQPAPQSSGASGLLVQKFAYVETKPGIFTANISAPANEGQYEITTVIEYKDKKLIPTETKLTAQVDPEGYVYKQTPDGKLRIASATVSLYWLNPSAGSGQVPKYELWPADKFFQKNPMVTDDTGKYSFLVPQGTYYISATAVNYADFKSKPFTIKEDNGVKMDIEMKAKGFLPTWFNWQLMVVLLLTAVVILLIIMIIKGRNNKQ